MKKIMAIASLLVLIQGADAAFAQKHSVPTNTSPAFQFKRVGGQGDIDFILVSPDLAKDPDKLRKSCRNFYTKSGRDWCMLIVWSDPRKVAHEMPMTDAEADAYIAEYTINPRTGYRKSQLVKHGTAIKEYDE